jgi:hypothetical protein
LGQRCSCLHVQGVVLVVLKGRDGFGCLEIRIIHIRIR